MVSPFEGLLALGEHSIPPLGNEDTMLDRLAGALIGSLADMIAAPALAMAEDAQARRETLAHYAAEARRHAAAMLSHVARQGGDDLRNRYADWLRHPRLAHEPLTAELRLAEIGLNDAVVALKAAPSPLAQVLVIAAALRLTAISDVLGIASIHTAGAARPLPPRGPRKPVRSDDRRLGRRTMRIDDVPPGLLAFVAQLRADDAGRSVALAALAAACGGPDDAGGMVTRLVTLAMRPENQPVIDALAAAAAGVNVGTDIVADGEVDAVGVGDDAVIAHDDAVSDAVAATAVSVAGSKGDGEADTVSIAPSAPDDRPEDPDLVATVGMVSGFVEKNRWALRVDNGRFSLVPLKTRSDINRAFDRVAGSAAMQAALRRIHEQPTAPRS